MFWRELTILGAPVYDRDDFAYAVELIDAGQVPVAELITRIVPIGRVSDAFAALETGGEVKVLVDCREEAA